jgi:hypothetical protein
LAEFTPYQNHTKHLSEIFMSYRIVAKFITLAALGIASWAAAESRAEEKTSSAGGVMPLVLPEQTNPEIRKAQDRIYRLAQYQARYLLTTVHPWAEDRSLKLLTASKSPEHFIRPNTCVVEGLSFLYKFGPYDEKIVGVSRKVLLEKNILPMMRYLTATHVTGTRPTSDGKKWGDHWQSALWAQMLGRAAWWMWDDLPKDLQQSVRRVIAHEADRFVHEKPPHNLENDTKAEENAWNSMIFSVAAVLMPSDSRRPAWEKAFQRWAMSAYLRPADEHSQKIVDGRPVSEQFTGANIYDDFTLENHGIVHPDYMSCFVLSLSCALDYAMSGRKPPEALLHNAPGVYENLKWFFLPDGGGVYPNGQDWALFNSADWPEIHIEMAIYGQDRDAWSLLRNGLTASEKMLARNPEGPVQVKEECQYPGSREDLMELLGRCWLMLQGAKSIDDRPQPLLGVKRLDSGKIILHRTPKAIHTVSWGATVMAQCVPWRLDRVVSPDKRDGVGHVQLNNGKDFLPVKLHSAKVSDSADGFVADLVVDHGDAVRAELRFRSNADGTFLMREKLTALRDCTTAEIATGLIGVLNNPKWVYETHRRRIQFNDQTTDVPSLSGKIVEGADVQRIDIDGALKIDSVAPLAARYAGAKKIERGRATDALYLNYLGGQREWKSGQVISTYEATVSP